MFALLALLTLLAAAPAAPVNLCTVIAHPKAFDGRRIQFRARMTSDGHHGSSLSSPRCELGVAVYLPDTVSKKDMKQLEKLVVDGTFDVEVRGTFTGKFRWEPEPHPLLIRAPTRILHVEEVSNLVITPRRDRAR